MGLPHRLFALAQRAADRLSWLRGQLLYRPAMAGYGLRTHLERPLLISGPENISIGERTRIRRGARLETLSAHGSAPQLRIGAGCNIEQNVHIVCHQSVQIEDDVTVTANCAIVDVSHPYGLATGNPGRHVARREEAGVAIGAGSFIGVGAVILPGTRLGPRSVVGANSVVTKSFPAGSVVAGAPAKLIRTLEAV